MKKFIIGILFYIIIIIKPLLAQVNFFNIYKPYYSVLCCPVNVYGLELQMNYLIINANTAELQIPVSLYWGVAENFEIGTQIVAMSRSYLEDVNKGIGDILFGAKYNFLKEIKEPLSTKPSVSAEIGVSLPTGDYKKNFGTGGVGVIVYWIAEKEVVLRTKHYFNLLVSVGYKYNTANPDKIKIGESLFYTFGSCFDMSKSLKFSFGIKGENKKSDEENGKKVKNTEKFDSYIYCGIVYDLDIYRKFFTSLSLGLTETSKSLIFNIGMMY